MFYNMDKIKTPSFVIDIDALQNNLNGPIKRLRNESGCKVLLALKGFSSDTILPYFLNHIDGFCASGLNEARLGNSDFHKMVSTFSPAYKSDEFTDIAKYSEKIVFNSIAQAEKYFPYLKETRCSIGLRINPEYSELPQSFGANPCGPFSHLGIRRSDLPPEEWFSQHKIEGFHIHSMCAQYVDTFIRTVQLLEKGFSNYLRHIQWINFGGGQLIADEKYNINRLIDFLKSFRKKYGTEMLLEPCEGIVTQCAFYVATVLDIVHNKMNTAILDGSAICHLSDSVYRGWRRDIKGAIDITDENYSDFDNVYRLAGISCYAGDIFGIYSFDHPLSVGERIVFCDAAPYTIVKMNQFNGISFPDIYSYSRANSYQLLKTYNYECFRIFL